MFERYDVDCASLTHTAKTAVLCHQRQRMQLNRNYMRKNEIMQTPWFSFLILNPELRIQAHPNHCSKAAAKYFSLALGSCKPEQPPPVIPHGPSHWNMQCLLGPQENGRSILRTWQRVESVEEKPIPVEICYDRLLWARIE